MKKISITLLAGLLALGAMAQKDNNKTLLWKISGNGLEKASYLYGTIHMLCEDDAGLSKNMKEAIATSDEIYFEVDMDNLFEMMGVLGKMKMKGDTTLKDLLSAEDYKKVKNFFDAKGSMLPFSSPIIMITRIPFQVPWWEQLLSMFILFICSMGMVYVAAKIYRVGILIQGKKITFKEIGKWIFY